MDFVAANWQNKKIIRKDENMRVKYEILQGALNKY
jgi:hypothetical protein